VSMTCEVLRLLLGHARQIITPSLSLLLSLIIRNLHHECARKERISTVDSDVLINTALDPSSYYSSQATSRSSAPIHASRSGSTAPTRTTRSQECITVRRQDFGARRQFHSGEVIRLEWPFAPSPSFPSFLDEDVSTKHRYFVTARRREDTSDEANNRLANLRQTASCGTRPLPDTRGRE